MTGLMITRTFSSLFCITISLFHSDFLHAGIPTPPMVWEDFDPDAGSFKEEIIYEKTVKGIYEKHAYISAYVNEVEVRVFCKYAVKEGSKNVPGLMNTHGWMGGPSIDKQYVNDGWAVISHDYSGLTKRPHHTKYPPELGHGHMDAKEKGYTLIYDKMPDGSQTTDPKATSHYLWNAIQRRVLSYLLTQKEVDPSRIGAKGYSYGGTIMWNLAMDKRVKAVVAYFGIGWINYYRDRAIWKFDQPQKEIPQTPGQKLFLTGLAPQAHAPYIQAASLWLNGSNDHHGGHERGCDTFKDFKPSVPWDFAVQARGHHNTEKLGDNCKVWLEKHVRGDSHIWPARPTSEIKLGQDGVPELHLSPANSKKIKEVQVYQCVKTANNIARFWRDVESKRVGNQWVAKLPVLNTKDYLFSYANIRYENKTVISSDFEAVIPSDLGRAVATDQPSEELPGGASLWKDAAPAEGVGGIQGFRPLNKYHGTSSSQLSMGQEKEREIRKTAFQSYQINSQLMAHCPNAIFMHCLPARRGEEVTDEVIDGEQSVVVTQAANRMHVQKGLLAWLLGHR